MPGKDEFEFVAVSNAMPHSITIDSAHSGSAGSQPVEVSTKQSLSVSHDHLEIQGFIFSQNGEFIGSATGREIDELDGFVLFVT